MDARLSATPAADAQTPARRLADPLARAGRVLVVDDDPLMLTLAHGALRAAGYEVHTASQGEQVMATACESQPDLILLDVYLGDMDGYALCRQLKQDARTRAIPVIFLTGLSDTQEVAQGFALGAVDYIIKPIAVPVLLARVRTHLALYRQRLGLEGMFRDVIEFAPDAFVLCDIAGAIVQVNARTEQLFGYSRQALIGRAAYELVPQDLGAYLNSRRAPGAEPDKPVMRAGIACRRRDGSEFPGDVSVSLLQTSQGPLFMALVRDATERQRQEDLLRELSARSEAAREEERMHIAREVHDELGQILTALRMDATLLKMRLGALDEALAVKMDDMKGLIDRGIQGVRNVAANLRPVALDMGLVPALEWLCQDTTARSGVACRLCERAPEDGDGLTPQRAVVLFRIVQESLTNVVRYASARQVEVELARDESGLTLQVRDDGVGFDPAAAATRKSFGLLGMRERALALGGHLEVNSTPGAGTTVRVHIPLTEAAP